MYLLSKKKESIFIKRYSWKKPYYLPKYTNLLYSTFKWEHDYIYAGLNNSTIIIDEGYLNFSCHEKLPKSEHTFFATSGHNNNDIIVIAQNYARINLSIRELANFFIYVHKFSNPFSLLSKTGRKQLTPLFFTVETYITEEDFKYRNIRKDAIWTKKRILFNMDIACAYDTQYYRATEKKINPIFWIDAMKNNKNINPVDKMNEEKEKEKEMIEDFSF